MRPITEIIVRLYDRNKLGKLDTTLEPSEILSQSYIQILIPAKVVNFPNTFMTEVTPNPNI